MTSPINNIDSSSSSDNNSLRPNQSSAPHSLSISTFDLFPGNVNVPRPQTHHPFSASPVETYSNQIFVRFHPGIKTRISELSILKKESKRIG